MGCYNKAATVDRAARPRGCIMNIDSYMPVKIVSGAGCVRRSAAEFKKFGDSCLIVTGARSAASCGALDDVCAALDEAGVKHALFDGVKPNPLTDDCREAGKLASSSDSRFIIGIGGGSALDAAKAVAFYASNPSFSSSDIYEREKGAPPLPVILVGTTAGTGSEVTGVSVLTDSRTGLKKSLHGADCYAAVAFCDSRYTRAMPRSVTVSTALDAFAHAVESYLSKASNTLSRMYAAKAIPAVWSGLRSLCVSSAAPDEKMRDSLYEASIFAGLAINITGTLFPHKAGYVLTENYGIPHGRACTAFLPALFEVASREVPERLSEIYSLCGCGHKTVIDTVALLTDVRIPISPSEAEDIALRWKDAKIANFINTPGAFDWMSAAYALSTLGGD